MSGPLSGIRVLDLTSVIMGPYASQQLADLGADVIKVEPPGGDVMRQAGPMRNPGMGHFYLTTNRNKRSIVLDLKKPSGRDALLHMAASSDVLLYNIRPQAMARLGLGYEDLKKVSPKIVYAGAYGFSQRGPYAAKPAYDDLIQGMCGIPWLTGQATGETPRYAPMVLVDRVVGLQLCNAITAALFYRERSGIGQRIDVPMFEGMLSIVLGEHLAGHLYRPSTGPSGYQRSLARDRRPYETSDGHICVLVYNDKHWRSFFDAIGKSEVFAQDVRFSSQGKRLEHIDHVYGFLGEIFRTRSTGEWLALLEHADIPAARMYSFDDILADPHLAETGYIQQVTHPSEGEMLDVSIPTEWSHSVPEKRHHAPKLGENTVELLREFGYSDEHIRALLSEAAVQQ
ncbi:CoA transferase [Hydrogenophaga aromaticivorans]|uniref:CaiB/BaiF CoA transferase family protein n=1 Tax=Hydrogenophaga aromaticivorans TaxID=2610898 RepID=UPI0004B75EF5|nr:CoA transferase [Hydrogenophaga aromaticivorans]MBQ0921542.1 CoA transferase [Hydrogenophaga aromaticivorans]